MQQKLDRCHMDRILTQAIRIPVKLFRTGLIRLLKPIHILVKLFRTDLIRLLKLIPTLRDTSLVHQVAISLTRLLLLPRVAMKL